MKVRFTSLMLAVLLILMAGSPAAAQEQKSNSFVDKVDVTDEAVTFMTKEGHYADFTLNVAGPDDFRLQRRFAGNATPVLGITTEKGVRLPDGPYTLEMTASPAMTDQQRKVLTEARQKGDRYQVGKLMKEIGLDRHAMIHSFHLSVAEGKFINPYAEEPKASPSGTNLGSVEGAPVENYEPMIDAVELTGQRWDAAYLPASPDANAQQAMLVSGNNAAPFARAAQAPAWYEATFQNTTAEGEPLNFHGYLRPVGYDGQGKLFMAYFRNADSPADGTWNQGYFLSENGSIRFLTHAEVTGAAQQAPLFDYVSQDAPSGEAAMPDQVILDDLIVDGSICAGFDCVNGESFGFDTIKMKENNLRLKADDTSATASFPQRDWQLTFNETLNGGAEKFSIDDVTGGRTPFTIEAGAPSHSLYVDDGGRIGLGTSAPVVEMHVVDGDTPTLRLQQDGTSGFTPQVYDIAANESNFFIRDVTNGSKLVMKIKPGAPTSSLFVAADGDVGMGGEESPDAQLHVVSDGGVGLLLQRSSGTIRFNLEDVANNSTWQLGNEAAGNEFRISKDGTGNTELALDASGNLTIQGICQESGQPGSCADYVFEEGYEMLTLEELEAFIEENGHLPNVPSTEEIIENGVVVQHFQGRLLEKIEELVLYTLEQQKTIDGLQTRLKALENERQK